ncbi:MAG: hypothetical protein ACI4O7_09585 [Aristaeellaceae bacterium]
MKRFLTCLLAMLLLAGSACADTFALLTDETWACTVNTYAGKMPGALQAAVARTPFAEDEVLQGVMLVEYHQRTNLLNRQVALIAVLHEGRPMLIGFTDPTVERDNRQVLVSDASVNDGWVCQAVSETLLREGQAFTLTAVEDTLSVVSRARPVLCYGEEQFILTATAEGVWRLRAYTDGSVTIDCRNEPMKVYTSDRPQQALPCYASFLAEDIDGDTFPTTAEAAQAYAAAHPDPVGSGQAVCTGANLRVKPTVHSDSLGMLERGVIAEVLGFAEPTKDNNNAAWVHVRLGDTEGYVSSIYMNLGGMPQGCEGFALPVCRLKEDTALLESIGGAASGTLAAGTVLTVLSRSEEGWLQVLLPEDASAWPMDVQGQYGWLREEQVTEAATRLQLKYQGRE